MSDHFSQRQVQPQGLVQKTVRAAAQLITESAAGRAQQLATPIDQQAKGNPAPDITLEAAIDAGLELVKSPSVRTALPLVAIGVKAGAKWLANHQLSRQQVPASGEMGTSATDVACQQCGTINHLGYKFCLHCGARRT
jgi:hypothetical protein